MNWEEKEDAMETGAIRGIRYLKQTSKAPTIPQRSQSPKSGEFPQARLTDG